MLPLCCDCGEDADFVKDGRQRALLALVKYASIACGGHAGDDETMRATVRQCIDANVVIGAHPSYADREGFGRRRVEVDEAALTSSLRAQVARLIAIAGEEGARVEYVKPHGRLYHDVEGDDGCARALAAASGSLPVMVRARSPAIAKFTSTIPEAFADRGYGPDGKLLPREVAGALLDVDAAVAQARAVSAAGWAQVLCVHSDGAHALAIASAIAAIACTKVVGAGLPARASPRVQAEES
jgi:UPF0271 protein